VVPSHEGLSRRLRIEQKTATKLVEPAIRKMQGPHIRLRIVNHYGVDSDNLESMSAAYGLVKQDVSRVIGGLQTHDDHLAWLRKREQLELEA
jgi:hypothetical protein